MDLQSNEAVRNPKLSSAPAVAAPSFVESGRIERAILAATHPGEEQAPPRLAAAVRHALFPGGARLRPRLCLAIATAHGDLEPAVAEAAAASVELMHCASLVHDDLPCFDDAVTRRGQPTVHRAFGESIAVLVGDQLIVRAFEHLARACGDSPRKLPLLISLLARGVGSPFGIVAGQAWESEPKINASAYRRAKTGALFEAAAALGAAVAGASPQAWAVVGARIGEAYQIADDIVDVTGDAERLGKPVGQDAARGRPNAVAEMGLADARKLFDRLLREAASAVPACDNPEPVRHWLAEAERRARGAI